LKVYLKELENASEPRESSDEIPLGLSDISDISLSISENFSENSISSDSSDENERVKDFVFKTIQSNSSLNEALQNELNIEHVSLGKSHGLAIISVLRQKRLFVWGSNEDYQLGLAKEVGPGPSLKVIPENVELQSIVPISIAARDDMSFLIGEMLSGDDLEPGLICNYQYDDEYCLECGRTYAFSLTERERRQASMKCPICQDDPEFHPIILGHKLFSWGNNCFNRLGYSGRRLKIQKIPKMVHPSLRVQKISLAKQFAVCIDFVGRAFAWGLGIDESLGRGLNANWTPKSKVQSPEMRESYGKKEGSFLKSPFKSAKRTKKMNMIRNKNFDVEEEEDSFDRQFNRKVSFVNLKSKFHNQIDPSKLNPPSEKELQSTLKGASNSGNFNIIFELNKVYQMDYSPESEDGFSLIKKRLFFENIICTRNGFILIVRSEKKNQTQNTENEELAKPENQNTLSVKKPRKRRMSHESTFHVKFGKTVSNLSMDMQNPHLKSNIKLEMVVFGDNVHQELLVDHDDHVSRLLLIEASGFDSKVVDMQAGSNHFVALTSTGKVYSWGDNRMGQCGVGGYEIKSEVLTKKVESVNEFPVDFLKLSGIEEQKNAKIEENLKNILYSDKKISGRLESDNEEQMEVNVGKLSSSRSLKQNLKKEESVKESSEEEDSEDGMEEIYLMLKLNSFIDDPSKLSKEEINELHQEVLSFEDYSFPLRNTLTRMIKKIMENVDN
jgi:alpha-tubulin suppressor-like RCC1 family protein